MYQIVIVEDSKILRQGMVLTYDWAAQNCQIVGEADNGEDGLAMIRKTNPDIVITDIRMPVCDGLEMIKTLRDDNDQTVCIVISAYDEFEYAQRAMQLGVQEFLVKPFENAELNMVLERSIQRVEQMRQYRQIEKQQRMLSGDYVAKEGDLRARYAERAITYIRNHYAENIAIQDIANELSMSESHLSRVFRESMDCTLGEYIAKYRINIACELLKDVRLRVSQVATRVGYADSRYFSVIFRRIVGMTPNSYRAQLFDTPLKEE